MAITPTYPGVYIEELPSPIHTIVGVATSITAFVGYTARGIDNRAEQILSFSDYERQFGGIDPQSEVSYSVQQFFANGGAQAYVVRSPRPGAIKASVTFSNLTFTALSSGAWANGRLLVDVDYIGVDQSAATGEPSAFNLTITNLEDGTVETFPSVSLNNNKSSYVVPVVNDFDTGSQLVNITSASPANSPPDQTGLVGAPANIGAVTVAVGGTPLAGTLAPTPNQAAVTGSGTQFQQALHIGQSLMFAGDQTRSTYGVAAITDNAHLTLTAPYTGTTTAITGTLLAGTVALTQNAAAVVGTATHFTQALQVGQFLAFSAATPSIPYRIAAIADDTHLTLALPYSGATAASETATMWNAAPGQDFSLALGTPLAGAVSPTPTQTAVTGSGTHFTQTLQVGQSIVFAADGTGATYGVAAITDDTHLTLTAPYAGTTTAVTGTFLTGTVALTQNAAAVGGTGTHFTQALQVGQYLAFSAATPSIPYRIAAITDDTHLTLAAPYSGATVASTTATMWGASANNDFGIALSTSAPLPPPMPLPLDIKVFAKSGTIPQTVAGLAAQLQQTINAVLAIKWPGASVSCSVYIPTGGTTQSLRIVGTFPGMAGQVGNNDAVIAITAPSATSQLVDASTILGLGSGAKANVAHYTLGTGNPPDASHPFGSQTASVAGIDGALPLKLPGNTEIIGDQLAFTGIYALLKVDLFNLLCIPDATRAAPGNPNALDSNIDPNAIYGAAITLCEQRRAMLLVDPPPPVNNVAMAVDWKTAQLAVHSPNSAAYFPRLRLPDPANNYQLRTFAPSGVVAGLYARVDGARGVWKAPAGTEATLTGVQAAVYKLADPENGVLNPLGLNCFRIFPIYGAVSWGARTLVGSDAEASQWKYVPVRRLALYIEETLYRSTKWAVFEPNDEPLWAQLRLNIGAFMHNLFQQGAFQGSSPSTAYLVKCDKDTTTQNDIDAGVVNILVGFAPLKPAEFVVIQIQQLAGQLQT